MPKRTDLKKIAVIGAGPIVIGQACEFDYSGTQACKALKSDAYEVVLINSNPATIMTDPDTADRTYIEPLTLEAVAAVLRKECPDALLPTLGGQTALNTAFQVADAGILKELGIELIGADREVINRAEDRDAFREAVRRAGVGLPVSGLARSLDEAMRVVDEVGLPCIIRPAFTLGGTGGGMAYNLEEFQRAALLGLSASLIGEILIEESVAGWKELEIEMMADSSGNGMVICTVENLDPMGVHTGDSITVAPVQTMTDAECQDMREKSLSIMRAIGIKTSGCNIQFAQNPKTGRLVAIELNPRVSRSSALASKATGFPIAKISAKVAVGYQLTELRNDIIPSNTACSEPAIDYVVVKIPRFAFEKFPGADESIGIQMKSVGEVMAIGRTFKEALQKGLRSMENGRFGFGADGKDPDPGVLSVETIRERLVVPNRERLYYLRYALERGMTPEEIFHLSGIDPWWTCQMLEILAEEATVKGRKLAELTRADLIRLKQYGFSDQQLGYLLGREQKDVRKRRDELGVRAVYRLVDTCAGTAPAINPYYYGTYGEKDESRTDSGREKILILGGGPNRIGQGIEFDYCCCHASFAARELGYESLIINCNPETVSTDFDTSDRLYFEPLTLEDTLEVVNREKPKGVIIQFGGQTPLNISRALMEAGAPILGTPVEAIERASDRGRFAELLRKLGLRQTRNAVAHALDSVLAKAEEIGYPVLMRPSFVLGGAKMEIIYDAAMLRKYWDELLMYCTKADVSIGPKRPVLIDGFLENATEVDVDVISDGKGVYIAGIMEHIEQAGIHSGDSACSLPPYSLSVDVRAELEEATVKLALELGVKGLMNVQFAIKDGEVFVLEVNPRASRTVPFVSKVTGVPIAKYATMTMLGKNLAELGLDRRANDPAFFGVKEVVFPFTRFQLPHAAMSESGIPLTMVDSILGPEMKSTGEVMGIDRNLDLAFAKSQLGAGSKVPLAGTAFISVKAADHINLEHIVRMLYDLGFNLVATRGTAIAIRQWGISVELIRKVSEGRRHVVDMMVDKRVHLVINTPSGKTPRKDEMVIRTNAIARGIPLITTVEGARAFVNAMRQLKNEGGLTVQALQDYHRK
ncbi:MAG: carbamoyl-phosphate synthase large subunit [Planctomycetes bacterium]|nr:carbamoyl-phosphate synthase large subunit [Planctomycetota bacterium]